MDLFAPSNLRLIILPWRNLVLKCNFHKFFFCDVKDLQEIVQTFWPSSRELSVREVGALERAGIAKTSSYSWTCRGATQTKTQAAEASNEANFDISCPC